MRSPEFSDDPDLDTAHGDDDDESQIEVEDDHPDASNRPDEDDDEEDGIDPGQDELVEEDDDEAQESDDELEEAQAAEAADEVVGDGEEDEEVVAVEIESRAPRWARFGDLVLDYKHWRNPRSITGLDPESLQRLADDIRKGSVMAGERLMAGINEPLLVVSIKGLGEEVVQLVLDGQRRHRAVGMTDLGEDVLIPVRDREAEPVEWSKDLARRYLSEVLRTVGLREGLSAFELSESAAELRATNDPATGNVTTIAVIAAAIGRSESWVSKILAARTQASKKLLARWRDGEISEEQFRDLATSVKGPEAQDIAADKVTEARKGGDKAGARVAAKEQAERVRLEAREAKEKAKAAKKAAKEKTKADREAKRAAKAAKKGKKGKKGAAVVKGPQAELPMGGGASKPDAKADVKPASPPKPKALDKVIIEDLLEMSKAKPPTQDLVRGVLLGIQVASGRMDFDQLPKPWHKYINHLSGAKR
jgi:hypothetical protein